MQMLLCTLKKELGKSFFNPYCENSFSKCVKSLDISIDSKLFR